MEWGKARESCPPHCDGPKSTRALVQVIATSDKTSMGSTPIEIEAFFDCESTCDFVLAGLCVCMSRV